MKRLKSSLIVFFFLAVTVKSVPRQLILYESTTRNERFHTFTSATPDSRIFPWIKNVQRICYLGSWYCYPEPGYSDPEDLGYNWDQRKLIDEQISAAEELFPEYSDLAFTCKNVPSGFGEICGSFRPAGGGLDLSMDTLTMFSEENMRGQEVTLSLERIPQFPPNFSVRSLAWTGQGSSWTRSGPGPDVSDSQVSISPLIYRRGGRSNWTVFAEADFRGIAECVEITGKRPFNGPYIKSLSGLSIPVIGSVKRGCDPADVSIWRIDRNGWPKLQKIFAETSYQTLWVGMLVLFGFPSG